MAEQVKAALTIMRRKQVEARTGLSRSSIYSRIKDGAFPAPISLGDNARAVGWVESEVEDWIAQQVAKRRAAA